MKCMCDQGREACVKCGGEEGVICMYVCVFVCDQRREACIEVELGIELVKNHDIDDES